MNQTLTQRMAAMQRPGRIEALRMMLAGDKSERTCRIAGAGKRCKPAPLPPLGGEMLIINCSTPIDPSLPF